MMQKKLVILGGPGDGVVVAQAVRDITKTQGDVVLAGFLNDGVKLDESIYGSPVLGPLASWRDLPTDFLFVPALHKVGEMEARAKLLVSLGIPEQRWASVVHPSACIADDVRVGAGSFIGSYVTIQPGVRIGKMVSIRAGANVGHDAIVEDFSYIGPNATLSGRAHLSEGAHVGPNAVVLDRIIIGRYAVIGIGAAVMKHVEEFSVCLGNPARRIRSLRAS